jgi:hypothetical protein
MSDHSRPLRRQEASTYLMERWGISRKPSTLAKLASTGNGPRFMRAGRVPLYGPPDLDAYAQSILTPPAASTAAHDAHSAALARSGKSAQEL